jgi:hypothetical protein
MQEIINEVGRKRFPPISTPLNAIPKITVREKKGLNRSMK